MSTIKSLNEIKGRTITLDFNKNNYISVTIKQYDKNSRNIFIKVANSGQILKLSKNFMVEIKMKAPDGRNILDTSTVEILDDGNVLFRPNDSMLAKSGKASVELRIYDLNSEERISTMNFYMVIIASPYDEDEILNSKEYKSLVDLYIQATADYEYVINESQTYANLAKISEENAAQSALSADEDATIATTKAEEALQSANVAVIKAEEASVSATNALSSEENAKISEENAKTSQDASKCSEENAKSSEENAKTSEANAKVSEEVAVEKASLAVNSADKAKVSETNTESHMNVAIESANNAKESENIAVVKAEESSTSATASAMSEKNAKESEIVATNMADISKSYAVGTSGSVRPGDDMDNSKYYYELAKNHALAAGGIIFMGTKTFAELSLEVNQETNYMFNISEDFRTDDTFNVGAGIKYSAGTNVCRTADGFWDVFVGINSFGTGEVITVSEYDEPTDQKEDEYWLFEY